MKTAEQRLEDRAQRAARRIRMNLAQQNNTTKMIRRGFIEGWEARARAAAAELAQVTRHEHAKTTSRKKK